ncbi:3-isopropylmalate dehydratase small subunit [Parahaliea maris]|uniref:3-isopropylmalate dehydratase small subunit n=1 Tax=Parahaliea maris TaxID=2716870 RepID=A0A5C8ZW80_9GAMM|nr:3-isopropylmalate dehydratase small subunit [Parahaliea maris]TXS92014.1 3-isopropylmalate dehydratase small subunit [Parahaliea maris]
MDAFTTHRGRVFPLDRSNVDTDAILPKQYLKSISKFGYADWLFDDWRYLDPGDVETDTPSRRKNPQFALNEPRYQGASILLAGDNFGCGSSREHAVWALRDFGFRAIIAPGFADIFFSNCFKNGLLPLSLPAATIAELFGLAAAEAEFELEIDLAAQLVRSATREWHFDIDPARKHHLLEGLDDIAVTLASVDTIRGFEAQLQAREPWLFRAGPDRA